ncbi:MAG: PQQ-like beta-propeller repeat protein [Chloroflexi bacterium]|nr:MAG: PQQ-like beta-propeller repeat protein [Chloroflexota bacterium]
MEFSSPGWLVLARHARDRSRRHRLRRLQHQQWHSRRAGYALRAPGARQRHRTARFVVGRPRAGPPDLLADHRPRRNHLRHGWPRSPVGDGHVQWSAQTGPVLKASPALGQDGTVYIPSMNGKLYAVAPPTEAPKRTGTVRWTFRFAEFPGKGQPLVSHSPPAGADGIGSGASPTIGPDGAIYVGANNSNFYAISPDGHLEWLFEAEREIAGIWSTAALSAAVLQIPAISRSASKSHSSRPSGEIA